ncbi:DNA-binding PadR family transcriptional regulator [Desulfobaculum xiamenense]|uniref:DNA-binding PadR family transcriptional regulator n=1 Tax=Desulfobaculum xiamenense TaxID=995050 RepID=A0A846QP66_9BACT|nr:hypothetical protein [Desulfobaculum xiamenense]NJB66499.1 DNA-binding PadR family transcriptional regulator [Desulfobaculum xiamenense]
MFNMKPPFRMMIASNLTDGHPRNSLELMDELRPLYGTERQFTREVVESHLQSLKAVGIVRDDEAEVDADGRLLVRYAITDFGRDKLRSSL